MPCMAHRLQLLTEKVANRHPVIIKYIAVLNSECTQVFSEAVLYSKELCGEGPCKVRQVCFTRWLSSDSDSILLGEHHLANIRRWTCSTAWLRFKNHYSDNKHDVLAQMSKVAVVQPEQTDKTGNITDMVMGPRKKTEIVRFFHCTRKPQA